MGPEKANRGAAFGAEGRADRPNGDVIATSGQLRLLVQVTVADQEREDVREQERDERRGGRTCFEAGHEKREVQEREYYRDPEGSGLN